MTMFQAFLAISLHPYKNLPVKGNIPLLEMEKPRLRDVTGLDPIIK